MKGLPLLLFSFLLSACTTISESGYFWGDYAKTSYLLVSDQSEKSLNLHLEELQNIVEISNEKDLKVPPGVYAEIGYVLVKLGREFEANDYFRLELKVYPEAGVFLRRFMEQSNEAARE